MPQHPAPVVSWPAPQVDQMHDEDPDEDSFKPSGSNDQDEGQPARKIRKTTIQPKFKPKQTKGRRGKLRQLTEMPIDILYEIFGHVRPHDLLRLSRTTKAMRAVLMRRSATFVWREALADVNGLPDCPSDLTEPQWAHLLFNTYCHFCAGPSIKTVFWQCRVRTCSKCIYAHFVLANPKLSPSAPSSLPRKLTAYGLRFEHTLGTLPYDKLRVGRQVHRIYLRSHLKALCDELHPLQGDENKISAFIKQKKTETNILQDHAGLCEDWYRSSQSDRSAELIALRNGRKKAIVERLRELGYGPELERCGLPFVYVLPLVDKPQELTERVWANIKEDIIWYLQIDRAKHVRERHVLAVTARTKDVGALFTAWKSAQPRDAILPGMADICNMLVCRALILDKAGDVGLSAEVISKVRERLPQLCGEWRVAAEIVLMHLMSLSDPAVTHEAGHEAGEPAHDRRVLELATTFFHCTGCKSDIGYPRILVHRCLTALDRGFGFSQFDEDGVMWLQARGLPWSEGLKNITYVEHIPAVVRCLLSSCNLDPVTTTSHEMDESDFWFECEPCWSEDTGALAMTWRRAVVHSAQHEDQKWKLLGEADSVYAKEADKDHEIDPPEVSRPHKYRTICEVTCSHCLSAHGTIDAIRNHLKHTHGLNGPISKDDYFVGLDNPPSKHPVRLLADRGAEQPSGGRCLPS
ncbi:hypothetical protein FIBSPDRAFT_1044341 [Athelia psychrophila]|uniref:F-box domain-containing protein n=1 Tax=Athelia psychrophila TaxID=1759441 RepID=A0A166JSR7_9AGAM|nr:hypothetical protein FIBSPDRAFT_1044341 [Fibularhizoctonia sp. CBS 109695]